MTPTWEHNNMIYHWKSLDEPYTISSSIMQFYAKNQTFSADTSRQLNLKHTILELTCKMILYNLDDSFLSQSWQESLKSTVNIPISLYVSASYSSSSAKVDKIRSNLRSTSLFHYILMSNSRVLASKLIINAKIYAQTTLFSINIDCDNKILRARWQKCKKKSMW